MDEIEDLKQSARTLGDDDRRWLVIVATLLTAIALFALFLQGGIAGAAVGFAVAFLAGWVACTEWHVLAQYRTRRRRTPL